MQLSRRFFIPVKVTEVWGINTKGRQPQAGDPVAFTTLQAFLCAKEEQRTRQEAHALF
jgi:hypothetical protein